MLVQADASQLEWRVAAELSKDRVAIDEILYTLSLPLDQQKKHDTHTKNQKHFDLPDRTTAKIYLFRTIYRGSGYAFAHDPTYAHVSTSVKFWDDLNARFYEKYHGLDSWHHWMAKEVMEGRDIVTPFGRSFPIRPMMNFRGDLEPPYTVFSNYPVQGSGADIVMLARLSFARRLKEKGWPVLLISTVHDSIVVDCPKVYVQDVVNLFYQVFDDLVPNIKKIFGYAWEVPLGCECKAGMNMLDMKEILRTDK